MPTNQLLHVSDWNYQDKYYRVPIAILKQMAEKIKTGDTIKDVWDWFVNQVDYKDPKAPIKRLVRVPTKEIEEALFFDYSAPVFSVLQWDLK